MKRPTIYDVAREAGVSAATVSYVINGRDDQKISDATRKKIMQIVNLFEDEENFDRLRACRTEQEVLDLIDRTNAAA